MLAAEVQRGTAAPTIAPSQTQSSLDSSQEDTSFERVTNVIISLLPKITPIVTELTEDFDERQLKTLETMTRFLTPIVRVIIQTQASDDGLTEKEEALLHDLETYFRVLVSLLQERREKLVTRKKSVSESIPDYTDDIGYNIPSPDLFQEHEVDVSVRKVQTPSSFNQRRNEKYVPSPTFVFPRRKKLPPSAEHQTVEKIELGRSFFALPGIVS